MDKGAAKAYRKKIKDLNVQVEAMKRIMWSLIDMNGGDVHIPKKYVDKAHSVSGKFDFVMLDDGSIKMKNIITEDYTKEEPTNDDDTSST